MRLDLYGVESLTDGNSHLLTRGREEEPRTVLWWELERSVLQRYYHEELRMVFGSFTNLLPSP